MPLPHFSFEAGQPARSGSESRQASFPSNNGGVSPHEPSGSHLRAFITGSPRQERPSLLRSFSASTIEPASEGSPELSSVHSVEINDARMADERTLTYPSMDVLVAPRLLPASAGGDMSRLQSLTNQYHARYSPRNFSGQSTSQPVLPTDRKLANRDYYPLRYHQALFDAFASQDPSFIQQREAAGLNSLDGDLDEQPLYAMPLIIECAILGSPQQKLTLSELRLTLKRRFRFYENEEARGARSWERTLLQNLSKKERFVNSERSEPGQGGFWTINHNAPPANRARKRVLRGRAPTGTSGLEAESIDSPTGDPQASLSPYDTYSTVGGPSSLFPTAPTEVLPDGRLRGRHAYTIKLPLVPSRPRGEFTTSSPRNFKYSGLLGISSSSSSTAYPGSPLWSRPSNLWS